MAFQIQPCHRSKRDSPQGGRPACHRSIPISGRDARATFPALPPSICALLAAFGLFFPIPAPANPAPQAETSAESNTSADSKNAQASAEIPALLHGVWRGNAEQDFVAVRDINLVVEFGEDKSCSIVLSADTYFTGPSITKISDEVHLNGSWERSDGEILATMRQTEWTQKEQELSRYGESTPAEETQRQIPEAEFLFCFDFDPAKQLLTYTPLTSKYSNKNKTLSSADGANLLIIIPIKMEKIENPLPGGNH